MSLLTRLHRLDVTARSADHSIRVTLSPRTGMRVAIDPRRALSHTDSSLGLQVSSAVRGALRATHQASEEILNDWQPPKSPAVDWDEIADRSRKFDELVEGIDVTATSGRGLVTVTWRGNTGVEITVRPRSLDNFGLATVTSEITDGLARASRLRSQETRSAHRKAYLDMTAHN